MNSNNIFYLILLSGKGEVVAELGERAIRQSQQKENNCQ